MKIQVLLYKICIRILSVLLGIRTKYSDPDPAKRFGSFWIRIHNTDHHYSVPVWWCFPLCRSGVPEQQVREEVQERRAATVPGSHPVRVQLLARYTQTGHFFLTLYRKDTLWLWETNDVTNGQRVGSGRIQNYMKDPDPELEFQIWIRKDLE